MRPLAPLRSGAPDFAELIRLDRLLGLRGHVLFTPETSDPAARVHVPFFGPSVGVAEDPVTGSANGLVGRYLARHDVVTVG